MGRTVELGIRQMNALRALAPFADVARQFDSRVYPVATGETLVGVSLKDCRAAANLIEWAAAELWRAENPEKSVFDCGELEKQSYRARASNGNEFELVHRRRRRAQAA